MSITFKDSLTDYLAIYFHFLDGFLNPNYGYTNIQLFNFLKKNNSFLIPENVQEIYFLSSKLETMKDKIEIELKFTNLEDNIDIVLLLEEIENIDKYNDKLLKLNKVFNYCIYQITANNHATSLLIYKNNGKIYVLSFNSGLGIDEHTPIVYGNEIYYSPYYGIELDDNIDSIKKIISYILLNIFYNTIDNYKRQIEKSEDNNKRINIDAFLILKLIMKLNKYIDFSNCSMFLLSININTNYTNYTKTININKVLTFNEIIELLNKYHDSNLDIKIKDIKFDYIFYYLLIQILSCEKPYSILIKDNFNNIESFNYFNNYVKNNIILHYIKDNLYITPQKSGSCTWFSIYWPLIYYYVINNNLSKYCNHIKQIYDNFILILNNIFTLDNFKNIIIEDKDIGKYKKYDNYNDIIIIKSLCAKFINIKLIDQSILLNSIDNIYKNNIKLNYIIDNDTTIITKIDYKINEYFIDKDIFNINIFF